MGRQGGRQALRAGDGRWAALAACTPVATYTTTGDVAVCILDNPGGTHGRLMSHVVVDPQVEVRWVPDSTNDDRYDHAALLAVLRGDTCDVVAFPYAGNWDTYHHQPTDDALDRFDGVFVSGAGNSRTYPRMWPADHPDVLSAAAGCQGRLCDWARDGDVLGPSVAPDGTFVASSGATVAVAVAIGEALQECGRAVVTRWGATC